VNVTIEFYFAGCDSNDGMWANNNLGQSLESDAADILPPKTLPGTTTTLLCALVGDKAFPFKPYLMRPYPRRLLTSDS